MATSREEDEQEMSPSKIREGDWICADCKSHNYSARVTCYRCSLAKEKSEFLSKGKKALDWECFQCKVSNFSWRQECYKCRISKHRSDDMKRTSGTVDWFCRFCDVSNFPDKRICFKCKRDRRDCVRDVSPRRRSASPGRGYRRSPPRQTYAPVRRRSPSPYRSRHSPERYNGPILPTRNSDMEDWRCDICGTINGIRRKDCYKCATSKYEDTRRPPLLPSRSSRPLDPRDDVREGDWMCDKCDINNFSWRKECFKCKEPRDSSKTVTITIANDRTRSASPPVKTLNHSSSAPIKQGLLTTPGDEYYEPDSPKLEKTDACNNATSLGPDWICRFCHVEIFPTRKDCYRCGRDRDSCEDTGEGSSSSMYKCGDCGKANSVDNKYCDYCDCPKPGRAMEAESEYRGPLLGGGPSRRSVEDSRRSDLLGNPGAGNPQYSEEYRRRRPTRGNDFLLIRP